MNILCETPEAIVCTHQNDAGWVAAWLPQALASWDAATARARYLTSVNVSYNVHKLMSAIVKQP